MWSLSEEPVARFAPKSPAPVNVLNTRRVRFASRVRVHGCCVVHIRIHSMLHKFYQGPLQRRRRLETTALQTNSNAEQGRSKDRGEGGGGSCPTVARDRSEPAHEHLVPVGRGGVSADLDAGRKQAYVRMVNALAGTVRKRLTPMPR